MLKPGSKVTGEELRFFLKDRSSDLALPSTILVLPELPKDAEGRILTDRLLPPVPLPPPDGVDRVSMDEMLHEQLIVIWQEILKTSGITIEDNFFECGGNSFLALRMMNEVGKLCGRSLPLSLLLTGATISNLARYIIDTKGEHDATSPLIPVQPHGSRTPLFFLHGDWEGGGFYCNRLATVMDHDRPFYALPPYRNTGSDIISLEAMAAYHVAALKEHSPHGPYILGGYCIGATVAIEMARQLMARGDTVMRLFLVDAASRQDAWMRNVWPWVNALGRARNWDLKKRLDFLDHYPVALNRWLEAPLSEKMASLRRRFIGRNKAEGPVIPAREALDTVEYGSYLLVNRLADIKPLSVPATLFYPLPMEKAVEQAKSTKLDSSKVDIEQLPGTHVTCITKYASVLGNKLKTKLADL